MAGGRREVSPPLALESGERKDTTVAAQIHYPPLEGFEMSVGIPARSSVNIAVRPDVMPHGISTSILKTYSFPARLTD